MDYLNADGLGIKHFGSQIKEFWDLRCASRFLLCLWHGLAIAPLRIWSMPERLDNFEF